MRSEIRKCRRQPGQKLRKSAASLKSVAAKPVDVSIHAIRATRRAGFALIYLLAASNKFKKASFDQNLRLRPIRTAHQHTVLSFLCLTVIEVLEVCIAGLL